MLLMTARMYKLESITKVVALLLAPSATSIIASWQINTSHFLQSNTTADIIIIIIIIIVIIFLVISFTLQINKRYLLQIISIFIFNNENGIEEWLAFHQYSHLMVRPGGPISELV